MEEKYQILVDKAFLALKNAYAPYSHFNVGACVLTSDGKYFLGANIENASYPAGNCGERTALFNCYANGYRKNDIVAIAIVTEAKKVSSPCGICRQVLNELLLKDTPIILANKTDHLVTSIKELLPLAFGPEDLA